jgi:hypothetical protein
MLESARLDYVMLYFWVIWCQKHHEGIAEIVRNRWTTLGCVRIDYVTLYLSKLSQHHEAEIA